MLTHSDVGQLATGYSVMENCGTGLQDQDDRLWWSSCRAVREMWKR